MGTSLFYLLFKIEQLIRVIGRYSRFIYIRRYPVTEWHNAGIMLTLLFPISLPLITIWVFLLLIYSMIAIVLRGLFVLFQLKLFWLWLGDIWDVVRSIYKKEEPYPEPSKSKIIVSATLTHSKPEIPDVLLEDNQYIEPDVEEDAARILSETDDEQAKLLQNVPYSEWKRSNIIWVIAFLLIISLSVFALIQYKHVFQPVTDYIVRLISGKQSGIVTFVFPNKAKYVGPMKNGKMHGIGTLIYENGTKYSGQFVDGKLEGEGTLTYPNNTVYKGNFVNGSMHGKGTLTYPSGTTYTGSFILDKMNGKGILKYADGTRYEGEFKDDAKNGRGILSFTNGTTYFGEFFNDQMEGQGLLSYPDGTQYSGTFKNNMPE